MANLQDRLFELVKEKDVEKLRSWFEGEGNGIDVNPRNDQGQTPLYWACEGDEPDLASVLIDNGADVNAAESFGYSPLHLAAYLGHENLTRVLINADGDVCGTNNEGSTPLHLAAKQGHVQVVRLIIASGKADLLAKDLSGSTPIQLCEKGSECFEVLRDRLLAMKRERDQSPGASPGGTMTKSSSPPAASPVAGASAAEVAQNKEQMEKMTKAIALLTSNIDVERARVATLEEKLKEEQSRGKDLSKKEGLSMCVKCNVEKRNRVFMPCMHFYYCSSCANGMTSCESCNVPINGKIPAIFE